MVWCVRGYRDAVDVDLLPGDDVDMLSCRSIIMMMMTMMMTMRMMMTMMMMIMKTMMMTMTTKTPFSPQPQ